MNCRYHKEEAADLDQLVNKLKDEMEKKKRMGIIRLTNRTHHTMIAVLAYLEKYLTEKNIPHARWLYRYNDKWHNILTEMSDVKDILKPMYILDPLQELLQFEWEGIQLEMKMINMDKSHLYKSKSDCSVFEPSWMMELSYQDGDEGKLNAFVMEVLEYSHQWTKWNDDPDQVVVFHWVEDYWEKINRLEKRELSTIYLPKDEQERIVKDIRHFLNPSTKNNYKQFGIPYHRCYCLYGPPGTGKSSLIMSLVSEFKKNVGMVRFTNKTDDISFYSALQSLPPDTFLVLEDIDCILQNREDKNVPLTFSGLLNSLDGILSTEGLVIFLTTNYFLKLDPAFRRPGRIDYLLEFNYTTKTQIYQMLEKFFPQQKENFALFYEKIKNVKMTTAVLQKFLFSKYPDGDILEDCQSLIKDAEACQFEKDSTVMYI